MKLPFGLRISHLVITGLLIATTGIILATRDSSNTVGQVQTDQQASAQADKAPSTDTGSNTATSDKSTSADQKQNSKSSTEKSQSNNTNKTASPACAALTADVAKRILGQQAASVETKDMSAIKTANTNLSSCAYTNGTATRIQVTVRTPSDNLGVSKNATVFGSDRPAQAVTVTGYGQAAFWDPDTHRLNILQSNIWYIVELGETATQATTETAASQLAVKL